jgi:hypothetical protein
MTPRAFPQDSISARAARSTAPGDQAGGDGTTQLGSLTRYIFMPAGRQGAVGNSTRRQNAIMAAGGRRRWPCLACADLVLDSRLDVRSGASANWKSPPPAVGALCLWSIQNYYFFRVESTISIKLRITTRALGTSGREHDHVLSSHDGLTIAGLVCLTDLACATRCARTSTRSSP